MGSLQENGFQKSTYLFSGAIMVVSGDIMAFNKDATVSNNHNSEFVVKAKAATNISSNSNSNLNADGSPKSVSQSSISRASKNLKNYVNNNRRLPNSVTVDGYKFSVPEFTYLMSKTVDNRKKKVSSNVTVKYNIKNPSKPSGTSIKAKIPSSRYSTYAVKINKFVNKNNRVPNFLNGPKNTKIQYQTYVYMFSSVLSYNHDKKRLPKSISLSVAKSHRMNKYVPNYVRTSNNNVQSNVPNVSINNKKVPNNAIWIQSKDFNKVNFNQLARSGINHVFLHEAAIANYGRANVLKWAKTAKSKGIKTHLWIQCFYSGGKWVNPVNTTTKSYNQAYFNTILSKINTYSKMDNIAGIHLDYLRYPGTAYKYNYSNGVSGEKAVTEFTRQAKASLNRNNPKMLLSAAVMPETSSNAYYYGQNIPQLGKYLDVITPMVYKGNYKKNAIWITATTNWFVKNSGGAKIWTGLQTYRSDNDITMLSSSELRTDSRAVLNGGADGIALFRWGLTSFLDFLSLY